MGIQAERKPVVEQGCEDEKPGFVVTFTNGALEQLEELQSFIGSDDTLDVVKVGISLIQRAMEDAERRREASKED